MLLTVLESVIKRSHFQHGQPYFKTEEQETKCRDVAMQFIWFFFIIAVRILI